MRYRLSEVSLFPFLQAGRRMKRYENPDTSVRAMHSHSHADKRGFSELQCYDTALGLTTWWWGVQSKHVYFAWQQHAASCCLLLHLKGKLCVYFHTCDVHYFHTMVEILCQFTQSQFFSYRSIKISTILNQRCTVSNLDCSLQNSTLPLLPVQLSLCCILFPPFYYFQLAFYNKCSHF